VGLQTEFEFTLPKGYIDRDGVLHRHGSMRLATARDEIEPLRDPLVSGADDPYLTILVIARVITELGTLPRITRSEVEGLFAADLAFLQDLYGIINFGDPADVAALQRAVLPAEVEEPPNDSPIDADSSSDQIADDEPEESAVRPHTPRRRGHVEEVPTRADR
jgi:hypothetical protein